MSPLGLAMPVLTSGARDFLFLWPILIGVGVFVFVAMASHARERHRRELFQQIAQQTGLHYNPDRNRELAHHFQFLNSLAVGSNRYASHVLTGELDGVGVVAFDYHYETHSSSKKGHKTRHRHLSILTADLPKPFPELTIRPEDVFSKVAQTLGYDDIDFESAEFSRRYCVRSRDKKFAYDVCHPLAMDFLMRFNDLDIEIEGTTIAAVQRGRLIPNHVESNLRRLLAFRQLLPDYLVNS